jgi:LuxR family maltose regulon positive regulatory protein
MVSRPRLLERLDAGLHSKLTLISASAGFGKTTLLSEWIADRCRREPMVRIAWLSLDEGDNDLVRFLTYLIGALQTVELDTGKAVLGVLAAPQPPPAESVLTALINEIADSPSSRVLVLDDYHLVTIQPIHDAVTYLLDHLPPAMHLVIATRADPPLPLPRLRIRGELIELRAADLRFTPDEAALFFQASMGLALSTEDVAALEARTEGWVAGLQVAALSLQGKGDASRFIQAFTGSNRYVLDYLAEEVLQRQTEAMQSFLLQTAVLDRLAGPLCDALTGRDDGQSTLERLERANLFIVPLDDERLWYRYHRLFSDLLLHRLRLTQPGLVPELHRRASEWCEGNGLIAEAVQHALHAQDDQRTARLVEEHAVQMLMRGELALLSSWITALPAERVRARPWLSVYHAWTLLLTGRLGDVENRLRDAEVRLQDTESGILLDVPLDERQDMRGHIAAIRAYASALQRDVHRASRLAREALELLPRENAVVRSVVTYMMGGMSLLSGDLAGASQAFAEASEAGRSAGNVHVAVPALSNLAELQVVQGRLCQAAETCRDALELATGQHGGPLAVAASAHSAMGRLVYEWNDLEAAAHHVMRAVELSERWGNVDQAASNRVTLARVFQAQGDQAGARDALREAERLIRGRSVTPPVAAQVTAYQVRLWLAQGNLAAASRWAQESTGGPSPSGGASALRTSPDDGLVYAGEFERITLARVLLAQGEPGRALALLERQLASAEGGGRTGRAIEILALQALAFQAGGEMDKATSALDRALSLAEPEGYVRTFVDEGAPMEKLLRHTLSRRVKPDYVARLLEALGMPAAPQAQPLVEPLSERELQVLRLIAAGLSNREIAQELVVTISTVKSHVNHIHGKLGVKSRTQAVARARTLGLLQS